MSHELTALYERLSHDDELRDEINSYKAKQTTGQDQAEGGRNLI